MMMMHGAVTRFAAAFPVHLPMLSQCREGIEMTGGLAICGRIAGDGSDRNRQTKKNVVIRFVCYCVCSYIFVINWILICFCFSLFFLLHNGHLLSSGWGVFGALWTDRPVLSRRRRGSGAAIEERPAAHQRPRELHRFPHATPRGAR